MGCIEPVRQWAVASASRCWRQKGRTGRVSLRKWHAVLRQSKILDPVISVVRMGCSHETGSGSKFDAFHPFHKLHRLGDAPTVTLLLHEPAAPERTSSALVSIRIISPCSSWMMWMPPCPVAKALIEGGVDAMELTLRTPVALECLRRIRKEVPTMTAGVGAILTPGQVNEAVEAGASFGVAPGMNPGRWMRRRDSGCRLRPASALPRTLSWRWKRTRRSCSSSSRPSPVGGELSAQHQRPFCPSGRALHPLGGVAQDNLEMWLSEPMIHAVGGSWLAPKELIQTGDWAGIQARAVAARATVNKVRGGRARA